MPAGIDIVVPVLNEAANIDEFHDRISRLGMADSLIFVDNGSTDGTLDRLAAFPRARVIRHAANLGYGASLRDGIAAGSAERIVIIDADLEYPPEAIPTLLAALEHAPAVYCSRFRGDRPVAMPRLRRFGNLLLSRAYNVLFRQRITDLYTGMKGLRRSGIDLRRLQRPGFEHCVELAALIACSGLQIAEIDVEYHARQAGRSKMRHVPETCKLLFYLLRYRIRAPGSAA